MINLQKINNQSGFTILELIIASTVFSLIMLLSTTGLIQIGKTYHKGQITSKTQETTRGVAEEISREVQYSRSVRIADPKPYAPTGLLSGVNVNAVCIGDTRYTYVVGQAKVKLGQKDSLEDESAPTLKHLLWTDKIATGVECVAEDLSQPVLSNSGRELLSQNMRLSSFSIEPSGDNVKIKIKAYYGDFDLAGADGTGICESTKNGGQFCASSELSTVVRRRI